MGIKPKLRHRLSESGFMLYKYVYMNKQERVHLVLLELIIEGGRVRFRMRVCICGKSFRPALNSR